MIDNEVAERELLSLLSGEIPYRTETGSKFTTNFRCILCYRRSRVSILIRNYYLTRSN